MGVSWVIGFFAPWAVVAALLFLRENRTWQARLPVIIVICVGLVFLLIRLMFSGFPASAFLTPFLALCIFWLYAHKAMQRGSTSAVIIVALIIGMSVGKCGALLLESEERVPFPYLSGLYSCAMSVHFGAMLGARYSCRRCYTPAQFRLMLSTWHLSLTGILAGLLGVAYGLPLGGFAAACAFVGAILAGFGGYIVQLPFMIMLFASPFYRTRFEAVMQLPAREQAIDPSESG